MDVTRLPSARRACRCILNLLILVILIPNASVGRAEGDALLTATYDETVMGVDLTWQFPYSDTMFAHSSEAYDHKLAQASLGLALSSFRIVRLVRPEDERERNAVAYLTGAGFSDFDSTDYDQTPSLQTVSSVICRKEMTDEEGPYTLIVVGVSGCGYAMEWLSNFTVGTSVRHEGFSRAAQNVEGRILVYLAERGLADRRLKLWITGFSRAAAISNIVAADMSDYGPFGRENVFAYTFASPRTTQEPKSGDYPNIFNIIGKMDIMTQVPLAIWGYSRYGVDLMTPAWETDIDYSIKRKRAEAIHRQLSGLHFGTNPETNHLLRTFLEYIAAICPDEAVYTEHIQETLKHMMAHSNSLSIIADFAGMASDPGLINDENRAYANELMDFVLSVIWDIHFHSGTIQSAWSDDATMFHNLFREHTPSVYLSWMFSSDDPAEIFSDAHQYERCVVEGDDTLVAFSPDGWKQTLYADGTVESAWLGYVGDGGTDIPELFMTRTNVQSVAILPADGNLSLTESSDSTKPIDLYCVSYDVLAPKEKHGFKMTLQGKAAEYSVVNHAPDELLEQLTSEDILALLRDEIGATDEDIQTYRDNLNAYYENIDYSDITDRLNSDVGLLSRIEHMNVFHLSWLTILYLAVGIPAVTLIVIVLLTIRFILRYSRKRRARRNDQAK